MVNVSTSILGLTVLAMGNSIGDFVADTAVARAGCE
jgi:solute carrier family 24 (sodium/potassium/calcium exchanger), member 6